MEENNFGHSECQKSGLSGFRNFKNPDFRTNPDEVSPMRSQAVKNKANNFKFSDIITKTDQIYSRNFVVKSFFQTVAITVLFLS